MNKIIRLLSSTEKMELQRKEVKVTDNGATYWLSRIGDAENNSISCYDARIPQMIRFKLQKIIEGVSVDVVDVGAELNKIIQARDDVAIENYYFEENSLMENELKGDLQTILRHYPPFLVDLVSGNLETAISKAAERISMSKEEVGQVRSFGEIFYNEARATHKSLTITKCMMVADTEEMYKIGVTHAKVEVDWKNHRVLCFHWSEGVRKLRIDHAELLVLAK